ncbi:MAG: TonB-dependent receptor [Ignavibacteria bacterium]|nr:TonB-dependent receptor [Ignavibacteria bacterium]
MNLKTMLIYIVLFFLVFFLYTNLYSQPRTIKGIISGKVIDKSADLPLESATIQVINIIGDEFVNGGASDSRGEFRITNIPAGTYNIKISYIGYNTSILKGIIVNRSNTNVNIGNIVMELSSEVTEEIEVTTEAPVMKMEFEKKVYELKQSIVSESGSAIDVLKNVPSVTVDNDGNISIRGSESIKIFIDGKPSGLFGSDNTTILEQIPSNSIEKIEIINNPSAKYEAEGMAGILNIILKKNVDLIGYNGSISVNAGTEDKYNTTLGISLRKDNFGISANYSFRSFRMPGTGDGLRTNFFSDSLRTLYQFEEHNRKMQSHFASLGFDYDINDRNNLNLGLNINFRNRKRSEYTDYDYFNVNNILVQNLDNRSSENDDGFNIEGTLSHQLKFNEKNRLLTTSLNYSLNNSDEIIDRSKQKYNTSGNPSENPLLSKDLFDEKYKFATFQSDYTHPLNGNSKFETGIKFNYQNINITSDYQNFDYNSLSWISDILKNDDYKYNQYIGAAYGSYAIKIKDFGIQAGLRMEYTNTDFTLSNTSDYYKNDYIDFFPSLNLTQKIGNSNELGLNYSRRINRPRARFLNPFVDYSDPLNLRSGNPELQPEYINAFELNYIKYFSSTSITSSVFFRNATDVINRFRRIDSSGISITTFENIARANSYGVELILQSAFTKWWNNMASFSYFSTDLKGNDGIQEITNSSSSWTGKIMSNIALPDIVNIQLAYNYFGKRVMLQGSIEPLHSLDIAFRKDFFNKRLSISLNIRDVLKTMKFEIETNGTGFTSSFNHNRNSRIVFLTLTYKFGTEMKEKKKFKKPDEENNNNMENDIDF